MVYSGCDEMALSGLLNGADGIIGSFYNAVPELFIDIYEAVIAGEIEKAVLKQRDAVRLITYSVKHQYLSLLRHYLKVQGVEAGYCRRPFINITDEEFDVIKSELVEMRDKFDMKGIKFLDKL
jgi:N-acetylneuraminate lyase